MGFSCSNEQVDESIIEKSSMVEIIADMELANGTRIMLEVGKKPSKEVLFNTIYNNHHITKQDFDKSLLHYSKKPKEMEQIYNDVITVLSQKQASFN